MSDQFLSSDDYAERAHQLYSEGRYDEALSVLRDGLEVYPFAVELHLGAAYAQLAREEYAWARASFAEALALDPQNEEALAGFGEVLLKLGERQRALGYFEQILSLGFREDHDLMLQIGRALFREAMMRHAQGFFQLAVDHHTDSSEAAACLGYAAHRLGEEDAALYWLRRALDLEETHAEARIYLGNLLYDRGEYEAALFHFERTDPADHVDELAVWRLIELEKSVRGLATAAPELELWQDRLATLSDRRDPEERVLAEVEAIQPDGTVRDPHQLELFGALLIQLRGMRRRAIGEVHRVRSAGGVTYAGTWEEIVLQMKADDRDGLGASIPQYMERVALRSRAETGMLIPVTDPESFIQGIVAAGLAEILR
jgi:tetratricopeptide (TPR) repeat protein